MYVNDEECRVAGLDPTKVKRIASRLSHYAREAQAMGLVVFGGSGSGTLRYRDTQADGALIVAHVDGIIDGGDGGTHVDDCGLTRGES